MNSFNEKYLSISKNNVFLIITNDGWQIYPHDVSTGKPVILPPFTSSFGQRDLDLCSLTSTDLQKLIHYYTNLHDMCIEFVGQRNTRHVLSDQINDIVLKLQRIQELLNNHFHTENWSMFMGENYINKETIDMDKFLKNINENLVSLNTSKNLNEITSTLEKLNVFNSSMLLGTNHVTRYDENSSALHEYFANQCLLMKIFRRKSPVKLYEESFNEIFRPHVENCENKWNISQKFIKPYHCNIL